MNSDAAYAAAAADAQKNLTLEFSRRARGVAIWAALRTLGKAGIEAMVNRHVAQAAHLAARLRAADYEVLNRPVLNQVLVRARDHDETVRIVAEAQSSGEVWFGRTLWQGRPAFRLSLSSWRITDADVEALAEVLIRLRR
jgi:glutamate/tyrosine decarboxylase-like PLP-dependent enzyme